MMPTRPRPGPTCLAAITLALGISAGVAWLVMLALGAIAAQTGWPIAIGYWVTWLIMFVVQALFSRSGSS